MVESHGSDALEAVRLIVPPLHPEIRFLSPREVIAIHYRLVTDFVAAPEPIQPSGVRDPNLLASAVARQWAGHNGQLLHVRPVDNAATLLYGLCLNHCFMNGNKRTSLVASLVHLDRNNFLLRGVGDNDLYDFLTALAAHNLQDKKRQTVPRDAELEYVKRWLRERCSRMRRGDRPLTFRQLRQILRRYNFELRNADRNFIDIYAVAQEKRNSFFGLSYLTRVKEHKVKTISYPGENSELSRKAIKDIREICKLTEADGVDSASFYDEEAIVEYFINQYRSLLARLAKT